MNTNQATALATRLAVTAFDFYTSDPSPDESLDLNLELAKRLEPLLQAQAVEDETELSDQKHYTQVFMAQVRKEQSKTEALRALVGRMTRIIESGIETPDEFETDWNKEAREALADAEKITAPQSTEKP